MTHADTINRLETIASSHDDCAYMLRMLLLLDFEFIDALETHRRIDMPILDDAANDIKTLLDEFYAFNDAHDSPELHLDRSILQRDTNEMLELLFSLNRHMISMMRLDESICPLHACDYCSCFDDDDPECAQIRECFPSHDT